MKNFYIAVQIRENNKYYAHMLRVSESDNLLSKLAIKNIITANIFPTKKAAAAAVETWRDGYRANGTYLFDKTF